MKFKDLGLKTKIMLSVCGPLILAATIGIVSIVNINAIISTDLWVNHTHKVMRNAEKIISSAVNMETGMRGYLLAGNEDFLAPYQEGEKNTFNMINDLQEMVSDNNTQVQRLDRAKSILKEWQKNVTKPNIALRRQIGDAATMSDIDTIVSKGTGKKYFDQLRIQIGNYIESKSKSLKLLHEASTKKDSESALNKIDVTIGELLINHNSIIDAKSLFASALDMETGMRGFLLAGDESFLEPYNKGEKRFNLFASSIKERIGKDTAGLQVFKEIEKTLSGWKKDVALPLIELRREIGHAKTMNDMADTIKEAKGKEYFDQFRAVMGKVVAEEAELMNQRLAKSELTVSRTKIIIIFCMIITIVLGFLLALYITSDIQHQVGGEPSQIVEIAQNVAKGDLDIVFDEKRLTGIQAALADMVNSLKNIAYEVKDVVVNVSAGRLDARGNADAYRGGWHELVSGINSALGSVGGHIDQIPSPFMIIDTEFNILSINQACSEWIGMPRNEILGKKCYDMFMTTDCKTSNCTCSRVLQSGVNEKSQAGARPGGKELYISSTGVPIKNDAGKIVAILEVFVDQTSSKREDWIKSGQNDLNMKMSGELNPKALSQNILNFLAGYLNAQVGVFYMSDDDENLNLVSSYAYKMRSNNDNQLKFGESMIGQAALERKSLLFCDVPDDHVNIDINSGLGSSVPKSIYVFPLVYEKEVLGVIGLAASRTFNDKDMEMLDRVTENISVNLNSARSRVRLNYLLEETQTQSEELQSQQEELKATNEALEQQTEELKSSEESLQVQQEELKASNEELIEKTSLLEKQKAEVARNNTDLEQSREAIQKKAKQLELATKYKTEFLANMSHELRTPLNSLLLLSKNLTRNKKGNLNKKQIQDAEIIYNSGNDLLDLINGILDLSKIESGKMNVSVEEVYYTDIGNNITNMFKPILEEKGLEFSIVIDSNLKEFLYTDQQKVEQILKNLMSNAIKFTEKGTITLTFAKPDEDTILELSNLDPLKAIAISVTDTGKGIPETKHQEIFEAFQQADGTIVRKYGGTGLGLSICKEFAKMLGGEMHLSSTEGNGAVFTFYIAQNLKDVITEQKKDTIFEEWLDESKEHPDNHYETPVQDTPFISNGIAKGISDDRDCINKDDNLILIIEDDMRFARILYDFCHEKGYQSIHAPDGETGIQLLEKYSIDAIILDIKLPGISGWGVLKKIKSNMDTRHIPVHVMSVEDTPENIRQKGAIGYLKKPVTNEDLNSAFSRINGMISHGTKKLLVVEDNNDMLDNLKQAFESMDVTIQTAMTGEEALQMIKTEKYDCMIVDLMLPDISGQDLLKKVEKIEHLNRPAVIIHTAKDLSDEECFELYKYANSMVTKSPQSTERLVDEVALFLHTVVGKLPGHAQKAISKVHEENRTLNGKKIMIVDDDVRNIYSIITTLDDYGIEFIKAQDGQKALEELEKHPNIDLILMDIMMPVMDGYEAIRKIRKMPAYEKLPILALTAKGMKKDRDQSFEAGATDYLMKPVDPDKLLSTIRVWLHS